MCLVSFSCSSPCCSAHCCWWSYSRMVCFSLAAAGSHGALPVPSPRAGAGCTGSRVCRPGSRFLRHKAPRQQLGGVTDASLRLLALRPPLQLDGASGPAAAGAATPGSAAADASQAPAALVALNAGGLSITDAALASLASCSALTSLVLRCCKRISDSGLLQLLLHCPALARLDVGGCSQLTAAGFGCYTPFGSQPRQPGDGSTAGTRTSGSSGGAVLGGSKQESSWAMPQGGSGSRTSPPSVLLRPATQRLSRVSRPSWRRSGVWCPPLRVCSCSGRRCPSRPAPERSLPGWRARLAAAGAAAEAEELSLIHI